MADVATYSQYVHSRSVLAFGQTSEDSELNFGSSVSNKLCYNLGERQVGNNKQERSSEREIDTKKHKGVNCRSVQYSATQGIAFLFERTAHLFDIKKMMTIHTISIWSVLVTGSPTPTTQITKSKKVGKKSGGK